MFSSNSCNETCSSLLLQWHTDNSLHKDVFPVSKIATSWQSRKILPFMIHSKTLFMRQQLRLVQEVLLFLSVLSCHCHLYKASVIHFCLHCPNYWINLIVPLWSMTHILQTELIFSKLYIFCHSAQMYLYWHSWSWSNQLSYCTHGFTVLMLWTLHNRNSTQPVQVFNATISMQLFKPSNAI